MRHIPIMGFDDIGRWKSFSSGGPEILLSKDKGPDGNAIRLDFDFKDLGGFLVARIGLPVEVPESYDIRFLMKGEAPSNIFEFKLIDSSNRNVWRYRDEDFLFPPHWREMVISGRDISFAWGPMGGGTPRDIKALEFVIASGSGGKGSAWVADLIIVDRAYLGHPAISASSFLPGHAPSMIMNNSEDTGWRSNDEGSQWLLMDFLEERELGGIVIHWEKGLEARVFTVALSSDGETWSKVFYSNRGTDRKTYIRLADTRSRLIRMELKERVSEIGFGIIGIEVKPYDYSRSVEQFFQNVALDQKPGLYPRYLLGMQSYWTVAGRGREKGPSLINEEGLIEPCGCPFSIMPFLFTGGKLLTWADVVLEQELEDGYLPIPTVRWKAESIELEIAPYACGEGGSETEISYLVKNMTSENLSVVLFLSFLPFHVTPPWQKWRSYGGATEIREISSQGCIVLINGKASIKTITPHNGFGAATFAEGGTARYIKAGMAPDQNRAAEESGCASGSLRFELDLGAEETREVLLSTAVFPPGPETKRLTSEADRSMSFFENRHQEESDLWRELLGRTTFIVPSGGKDLIKVLKTCASHILINSRGPALCPGPRRYSRAWIRDGVVMGIALIKMGVPGPLKDFLSWYGSFQAEDGRIPDCADDGGSEWLQEFDAYGQFIHGIAEYFRFTGDSEFVLSMWPKAQKAVKYMEQLIAMRATDEFASGKKAAFYGILPESISHEGYMANPVHSYWDDFWALRGLQDSSILAHAIEKHGEGKRIGYLAETFLRNLKASIERTIADHGIEYLPGSVELGDFDPAASSIGITLLPGCELLPPQATQRTFEIYLEGLKKRSAGLTDWNNYSPYEIRIIGALVMLGMREEAMELAGFMLSDRRIAVWNQWPEISWKNKRAPAFLGDLPHTWISAEYVNAVRCMFAYERITDDSLVLAEGLPFEWLDEGAEIGIRDLPTYFGDLSYSLRKEGADRLRIHLGGGLTPPSGGIIIRPPLPVPMPQLRIAGTSQAVISGRSIICRSCPADILLSF